METRTEARRFDADAMRFEQESRDEDRNPAPADIERIWADWDRYDAEQAQRWEVSGE
jgi:hypothetical protein